MVLGQVTKLGSNLLSVQPGKSNEKGPPSQLFGIVVTTLTAEDAQALRDSARVPHAVAANAVVRGSVTVTWQSQTVDTNFVGTDYNYPNVINFTMSEGQFFDQQEDQGNASVVVLGSTVADELFGGQNVDPVGQIIKVRAASQSSQNQPGGIPLRVIGVIQARGSSFFQGTRTTRFFCRWPLASNNSSGISYLQAINIKVDSSDTVQQTISDADSVMRQQHHIKQDVGFGLYYPQYCRRHQHFNHHHQRADFIPTAMAAIALLVGGIGILNIMMVTVAERTREIGLRKAVGAGNAAIRNQFLLEAGTLTSLGGIIGIIVGVVVSYLISLFDARPRLRLGVRHFDHFSRISGRRFDIDRRGLRFISGV